MTGDMKVFDLGGAVAAPKPWMSQNAAPMLRRVDLAALRTLARQLAAILSAGDVVLLKGPLGAGKSEFARTMIHARMGDDAVDVPSPTFTLVQTYDTPSLMVTHADLYRVQQLEELTELGLDEAMEHGAVLVEWPERAEGLWPSARLEIALSVPGDWTEREIRVTAFGDWRVRLAALGWDGA